MIGIIKSSLPNAKDLTAIQALQAAAQQGLKGLLFNSLYDISPTLDPAEMKAARAEADRLGLFISASLGVLNPALPFRGAKIVEAGNGDMEAGVRRLINLAADIGIKDLFFVIGMIEERFNESPSWQAQRDAVADLITRCAPLLRERGARLLIKTHEEITTTEIVEMVNKVGSDLLGVAYDPVNVLCRMEDPVEAARRVAPYAAQVHVDDAIVRFQEGGIRRFLAPLGEGELDWDAIFALMPKANVWVEMHSGQFAMPVFDAAWLRQQPGIALTEYASVLAMAVKFGAREMPWDQTRPADRLPQAYGKLLK
ncbi:sugar phosphate isomerase/epimerase family protein [Paradevosia shaoguanensis]|uniref:Sugar phosphate isomerase/epimerase n=1 Tax=Paradevosia shaoguanensis TaxID=1335043 RepID=A0AA41QLA0_9HYPH|nr:sugar phosphate isomerase/epimerase family protein [Paradevosia shaoguanensis]MCF1741391.1 sugar phosphate isomerase/epimerase [Paradevosia shaoguanensis]MCI0125874.1 sugar phosphate isomerase/epimerase [Paradevosia shaoguanensis]